MSRAAAASDHCDVVVVGGGVAGLAAAAALADRDVVVLERSERLGGRLASDGVDGGLWLNRGAHVFGGRSSSIGRLVTESGLTSRPVTGLKSAVWFGGRLYRHRAEAYPFVLPLSVRERYALARLGVRIRVLAYRWRRAGRRRPGESWPQYRSRFAGFEGDRSFAAVLADAPPRVGEIFRSATRRSAGDASEVSVGAATSIFGALWVGDASESVTTVIGGSGLVGERWTSVLGERAVHDARVTDVAEHDDHVVVTVNAPGPRTIRASRVVVATPAPIAADLLATAPTAVREQLRGVAYGPFVCLSVLTDDIGDVPWDDVYAIATPGLSFDMLFNHSNAMRDAADLPDGRKSLMCYAGGEPGRALLSMSDDEVKATFVDDLECVLPQLRGAVRTAVVTRWERGNCFATPGSDLSAVVAWNARPHGRVRLAGDYFGPLGGTADAAAASGYEAAAAGPAPSGTLPRPRPARVPTTTTTTREDAPA